MDDIEALEIVVKASTGYLPEYEEKNYNKRLTEAQDRVVKLIAQAKAGSPIDMARDGLLQHGLVLAGVMSAKTVGHQLAKMESWGKIPKKNRNVKAVAEAAARAVKSKMMVPIWESNYQILVSRTMVELLQMSGVDPGAGSPEATFIVAEEYPYTDALGDPMLWRFCWDRADNDLCVLQWKHENPIDSDNPWLPCEPGSKDWDRVRTHLLTDGQDVIQHPENWTVTLSNTLPAWEGIEE